jgi:hypothetical protein
MLDRFGGDVTDWYEAEPIGVACMLRPAAGNDLRRAIDLVNRAAEPTDSLLAQ